MASMTPWELNIFGQSVDLFSHAIREKKKLAYLDLSRKPALTTHNGIQNKD
jgi:hypothetical protein